MLTLLWLRAERTAFHKAEMVFRTYFCMFLCPPHWMSQQPSMTNIFLYVACALLWWPPLCIHSASIFVQNTFDFHPTMANIFCINFSLFREFTWCCRNSQIRFRFDAECRLTGGRFISAGNILLSIHSVSIGMPGLGTVSAW